MKKRLFYLVFIICISFFGCGKTEAVCKVSYCEETVYKRGLCPEHYVDKQLEKQEAPTEVPILSPTTTPTPEVTSEPTWIPTVSPTSTVTPTPTVTILNAEDIYEMAILSVVEITANAPDGISTGSGFFYDETGTVVTNYHVIEGCDTATITLHDGTMYDVINVLGYSEGRDIAILSTACTYSVPLKFRTDTVRTGETVYAIGSSLGLKGSLSNGLVSASERIVDGYTYIQMTAPISHGNSGGPLLDKEGYVVGITSASFVDGQNLNLAIPISEVSRISTEYPTTMAELFKSEVEWLSDWDFFYYEEMGCYAFTFSLEDEDRNTVKTAGTVEVSITNDDGIVVYNGSGDFTEEFYEEWIYEDSTEHNLVTFYISPEEIDVGTTSSGVVSFIVYGEGFDFDETTIEIYDLPTESVQVQSAYDYLLDWLWVNGEVQDSMVAVSETVDIVEQNHTFILGYDVSEDLLFISVFSYIGQDEVFCTIDLHDNNGQHEYSVQHMLYDQSEYSVPHMTCGHEIYGSIDGRTYTDGSPLTYDMYTGPSEDQLIWEEISRGYVDLSLAFFDMYLQLWIPEIDISEFGFWGY